MKFSKILVGLGLSAMSGAAAYAVCFVTFTVSPVVKPYRTPVPSGAVLSANAIVIPNPGGPAITNYVLTANPPYVPGVTKVPLGWAGANIPPLHGGLLTACSITGTGVLTNVNGNQGLGFNLLLPLKTYTYAELQATLFPGLRQLVQTEDGRYHSTGVSNTGFEDFGAFQGYEDVVIGAAESDFTPPFSQTLVGGTQPGRSVNKINVQFVGTSTYSQVNYGGPFIDSTNYQLNFNEFFFNTPSTPPGPDARFNSDLSGANG